MSDSESDAAEPAVDEESAADVASATDPAEDVEEPTASPDAADAEEAEEVAPEFEDAEEPTVVAEPVTPEDAESVADTAETNEPEDEPDEPTVVAGAVGTLDVDESADEPTVVVPPAPARAEPTAVVATEAAAEESERPAPIRQHRWPLIAAAVLGLVVLVYVVDLVLSSGEIPRDVVVAGVAIGGMEPAAAEEKLRSVVAPRLANPAEVGADGRLMPIDPAQARVEVDWRATMDAAGERSLNPWRWLKSFFAEREVPVAATGDDRAIRVALALLAEEVNVARIEGNIKFDGLTPVPVMPVPGKHLDLDRAAQTVITEWAGGGTIGLTVDRLDVLATPDGVQRAVEEFARPAVAAPVTVRANGSTGTLEPEDIAGVLTFTATEDGDLTPGADEGRLRAALGETLGKSETKAKDASIKFGKKRATVVPSVDGHEIDWRGASADLVEILPESEDRALVAEFTDTKAKLTTEQLEGYGIKEVVGKFTTGGFVPTSGANIRTVAKKVNGAIVKPGATFSLNGFTGPRGLKQGYIESAIIREGVPDKAVGGGISQFATTLYNASYFAAMEDVEHHEHSYYISRYPLAREATVFQNPDGRSVIDLKFRNPQKTGIAIQTIWTPYGITVKLWGTKEFKVESKTGDPYNHTSPDVITRPYGEPCVPQEGASGYTADNTRFIYDLDGDLVDKQKRTVRYNAQPVIKCAPPPPPPKKDEGKDGDGRGDGEGGDGDGDGNTDGGSSTKPTGTSGTTSAGGLPFP